MTPKEKAEEMVSSMEYWLGTDNSLAKECAIIAVEELIKVAQDDIHFKHTEFTQTHQNYKSYWKLVKQEIEKL